ncbi:hypothetical protein K470DRAFT_258006 [Piedraia hortae CBS 480.64]|uniref:HypA-like protein n=1 Tax=Piedraia hortae CBS 480.64 TaxID=1314780 RepID=A0A6A7BYV5_9PEZI|nr:hypothetical protein K470DRAFT_258006 [Piedraia hortae CBS 480.64]
MTQLRSYVIAGRLPTGHKIGNEFSRRILPRTTLTRSLSMAYATTVNVATDLKPVYSRKGISKEATDKTNELLQKNHDQFNIFFNNKGFHNHIAHHLLTIWSLRATEDQVVQAFKDNESYQMPAKEVHEDVLKELYDPKKFSESLGVREYYHEFLIYFQKEIEQLGWQKAISKHVLEESENNMLVRLYAGLVHPIIHLGFGVEFEQPAIVAEALAETAVHRDDLAEFFHDSEKLAKENDDKSPKSIVQMFDAIYEEKTLRDAIEFRDEDKLGTTERGKIGDRVKKFASQFHVQPNDLERKNAELTNASAYLMGAAPRPNKIVKFDFFLMHTVTSSIFLSAFLRQDWIKDSDKARLLAWKSRYDLVEYVARGAPELRIEVIRNYKPKQPSGWDVLEDRVVAVPDDGHAAKTVRALAHGQRICEPYEHRPEFRIKHDDWLQLAHMTIDSVEGPGDEWIRNTGFDEAWKNVPARQ